MEKLEAAIEAILFSAGDSVETGRIAKAIDRINYNGKNYPEYDAEI